MGGGGAGGAAQSVRGKNIFVQGDKSDGFGKMHQFIMAGRGAGRAGHLNLCVQTIHPLRG